MVEKTAGGVQLQFFPKMGTLCSDTKMPVRAHIGCRLHFFCQEMYFYGRKMSFSQYWFSINYASKQLAFLTRKLYLCEVYYYCDMEEKGMILLNEEYLMSKICIIRGVQVMLDFDLAAIYGYETRFFTRQVNNNIERFEQDFRFQLTKEEFKNLMCKNFTSR